MESKLIKELFKNVPLESKIKATIEFHFIRKYGGTLFIPLDKDGNCMSDAVEANEKCIEKAQPLIEKVLGDVKQWKETILIPTHATTNKAVELLRNLADLQNGPPLMQHKDEWKETMAEVYAFLNRWEED